MTKKSIIGGIAMGIFLATCIFTIVWLLDRELNVYPRYVIKNGDAACQHCFGENMSNYHGGSAWTEITCTGTRNMLVLWAEDKPDEAGCWDPESQCRDQNKYLAYTTLEDYNCEQIRIMIDSDSYVPIERIYKSKTCTTNITYETGGSNTNGKGAKDSWVMYYLTNCTKNMKGE